MKIKLLSILSKKIFKIQYLLFFSFCFQIFSQEDLPRTTTSQVHPEKYENIRIFESKKNKEYTIVAGHNSGTSKRVLTLNGQDISHIMLEPNDIPYASNSCSQVDISGDLISASGAINATQSISTDIQTRFTVFNGKNLSVLRNYTFRNSAPEIYLADHILDGNKYLYILISGITSSSKIETQYSGFPAKAGGIALSGTGAALIQINLADDSIREKYWETSTSLGGNSMALDDQGNVYFITLDDRFGSKLNVLGFDENLNQFFSKTIDRDPEADYTLSQPLAIYESEGEKIIALTDGRLPVTIDFYSGEVHYSKNQDVEGNTSKVINDINDMGEIQVLSNGYFILSTKDLELEFGNGWFIVFDTEAQRKLYFREQLELPEENSIARPYIVSYYVDQQNNSINYTAAIYQDGVVKLNDVVLADGSQDPSEVILFSGTISGFEMAQLVNRGVKDLSVDEGDLEFDVESNIYTLSGNNNLDSVDLTAEPYPGYKVFPDAEMTVDLADDQRVYISALDVVDGNSRFSNFYIIYEVTAPARLSTTDFSKDKFRVYPNPTSSVLKFKTDILGKQIKIYNLIGQLVFSKNFIDKNSTDISNLKNGMYILKIIENDNLLTTQKVIKN